MRRNFFTRCSLFFEIHSLLVTRCKILSLLLVEVARCKKRLVTRCKIRSLLVAEAARCKKSLVTCCKIRSLLIVEVARCKKSLVTRCKIRSLLVSKIHLLFIGQLISITTYYVKSLLTRANFS